MPGTYRPYRSFFHHLLGPVAIQTSASNPLKWLTPVVVLGGIVATALISFLNVAATGYELVSTSSSDPNAVEANIGARASCDPTNIQLQSTIYTDKRAFPYTLSQAWQLGDDGSRLHQGSLIYKRSPVQNCNITLIDIQFEGPDRTARQLESFTMGGTVTATTECYIDEGSPSRRTYFELLSTYDAFPPLNVALPTFPNLNKTRDLSQYWGSSILNMYWATVMQTFFDANVGASDPFFKGVIDMKLNTNLSGTIEDQVSNIEFLRVRNCFFIPLNSTGIHSITTLASSTTAFERPVPAIWLSVAVLAKAMWFSVLGDLARPELLANLSSNMTQANQTLRSEFRFSVDHSDIFRQSFDSSQPQDAQLRVNQSILAADYLCQVPRLKSPGNLILSVLVADLVILQTIWKVFGLVEARCCTACTPNPVGEGAPIMYESIDGQESETILLHERSPSQKITRSP
ncbi:hypothetical protein F5Y13DRAFT_180230 [Hypoxylon sp. FL1857]|nr:hypothetical protein F5Y13DRAFT_180230 [Hypoxylon sp. FL1857]